MSQKTQGSLPGRSVSGSINFILLPYEREERGLTWTKKLLGYLFARSNRAISMGRDYTKAHGKEKVEKQIDVWSKTSEREEETWYIAQKTHISVR